jgi:hypothetical protein
MTDAGSGEVTITAGSNNGSFFAITRKKGGSASGLQIPRQTAVWPYFDEYPTADHERITRNDPYVAIISI